MTLYACGICATPSEHRFCDAHGAAKKRYGRTFTTNRRRLLANNPLCAMCRDAPATIAHHHPHSRRELLGMGITDPDAPHRMIGVCAHCHAQVTAHGR